MDNILNIEDINFQSLKFSNIKESRGGSYVSELENVKYINLPKSLSKEGFSISNKNCYIDIELNNNTLFDFLKNIDNYFKQMILENSQEWLSFNLTNDQVNDFYESIISYRKKFNRDPYFRLKIPLYKQNIAIRITDEDNVEINSERLPDDEMIFSGILELKGIKFLKQEVVCDIELASIILHNPKPKLNITGLIKEKKNKKNKDKNNEKKSKSNREESNREESNREESKREESKREESNREESNREESKREESNRGESNREESNREESKREESKREESKREENEEVSLSYYKDDLEKDNIDIKSMDNIIKEKKKIINELESKKKNIEDQISQRENKDIISDSYSEIDRREEKRDKIIRKELIDRLRDERNKANTLFAEAQKVMEVYEEKRENALHQVSIVKELEFELSNLE